LQKATNVFGPFTDAGGATSPKTNAVGQVNTFWRVRLP